MADLAAFLTSSTAREALARRDISAVFGILRDAGVTQSRIATATGQRQSEVSEIVSGRQVQSVAVLERIADGLGVPRGWMGLAYTADTTSPEPPPRKAPPDPTAALLDEDFAERVIRAKLLDHGITVLFGKPDAEPAAPTRIRKDPTPVPHRVGRAELAQVTAVTERLGQLNGALGGIPVTDALTAHATTSEALLDATMDDPVRQQLLVVLSDVHRTAGSAAAGAGMQDRARAHFSRSMECAGAGNDQRRAVVSLGRLGSLELRVEPSEALKFFRLGAATAPTPLTRSVLQYDCAVAFARLGQADDALRELRWAAESFAAASEEPRPWKHFAAALSSSEGSVYFALGRFDRAVVALSAAVEGTSHAVVCTVANSGLLAAAQLRCGELRLGLATAGQVITLARGLRSAMLRSDLAPLQQAAVARRESACQDLAREVAALRRAA